MKKLVILCLMLLISIKALYADGIDEKNSEESVTESAENIVEKSDMESKSVIDINGASAVIMEAETGKILFEKNADEALSPASMTKIMTMLLVVEAIDKGFVSLNDQVTISENSAGMGGSQVYLEKGSVATVQELLTSVAIASANDGAVALAEKIGGTEENFVAMMNKRAKELGCTNTNFKNPHGLDEEGHAVSAKDMALIARELVKHEEILELTKTYETTLTHQNGKSIWLVNTNSLIRFYSGLDGLKTGYTENAGYCLTGTMERNDMRLITVVMKANSKEERNTDTINMMEYAFSMFYKGKLLDKNKSLGEIFIDDSKTRNVKYYLKNDVSIVLNKERTNIDYEYDIKLDKVTSPIKKGEKIGSLILHFDNEDIEYDLTVNENIEKSSFFGRMINYLKDILNGNISVI